MPPEIQSPIYRELARLARFGANVADAYSCLIFLPEAALVSSNSGHHLHNHNALSTQPDLVLVGAHTLSSELIPECRIRSGAGLIGWVAKHNRSIHVSPFDRDSTTLGVYSADQQLKSFIGVPIGLARELAGGADEISGVLCCDSRKSFAFSKLQGKLLEELALQVSTILHYSLTKSDQSSSPAESWGIFSHNAMRLIGALGGQATELLRVRFSNLDELEGGAGSQTAMELLEQAFRLIQQSLPPHFPICKTAQGDFVIVVDNMMSTFCENKIRAICERLTQPNGIVTLAFARSPLRGLDGLSAQDAFLALDQLAGESALNPNLAQRAMPEAAPLQRAAGLRVVGAAKSPSHVGERKREYRTA